MQETLHVLLAVVGMLVVEGSPPVVVSGHQKKPQIRKTI